MAHIHFAYNAPHPLTQACQLLTEQLEAGEVVAVYCPDAARRAAFDQLLWSFDPGAFVPHALADDPRAARAPVVLHATLPSHSVWLLNLADTPIANPDTYAHILEVIGTDPEAKADGRARWRHYQAAGHTVVPRDLSSVPEGAAS